MSKKKERATVIRQEEIGAGIYDLWIATAISKEAKPGQFVMVYPMDKSTILPRPISICEVDTKRCALRLVYRVAGKGTKEFSWYHGDDHIDIMGPIGNGFDVEKAIGKKVALLGGGIGIPPMVQLAKELKASNKATSVFAVAGYRDGNLFLKDSLESYATFVAACEDGSAGVKGNVIDALNEKNIEADVIYACGPMPMLRAIKKYAEEKGIIAYISLEERMACGVGACLGCVCKTTKEDHHSHVKNARVCTEGPVFNAEDVEI